MSYDLDKYSLYIIVTLRVNISALFLCISDFKRSCREVSIFEILKFFRISSLGRGLVSSSGVNCYSIYFCMSNSRTNLEVSIIWNFQWFNLWFHENMKNQGNFTYLRLREFEHDCNVNEVLSNSKIQKGFSDHHSLSFLAWPGEKVLSAQAWFGGTRNYS